MEETIETTETPVNTDTPQTTDTPATTATTEAPKNLLDGEETPGAGTTDTPAAKTDPSAPKNLLDDEPEKKTDEPGNAEPPTEEAIKAWTDGIKATDLGDGVKWDDAALKEMTPALMEISGGDPKKAEGVVKAYTAYQQKVAKQIAEANAAFNSMLLGECEKRFGTDLKKVVGYAKKGGAAIFGDKIWNAMKREPRFANNPDILEKLADFGRKISTDTGRVVPKDGTGGGETGDVLHRMYGNVKV